MADPGNTWFEEPQWISFSQSVFYPKRFGTVGFTYWLSPGCLAQVYVYTPWPLAATGPAMNTADNWDQTGDSMNVHLKPGTNSDVYDAPYQTIGEPWDPSSGTTRLETMQISFPYVDPFQLGTVDNPQGVWKRDTPRFFLTWDAGVENSGYPLFQNLSLSRGRFEFNMMNYLTALFNDNFKATQPMQLSYQAQLSNSGYLDLSDFGNVGQPEIAMLRLQVTQAPDDVISYRSTPPMLHRVGYIAFGQTNRTLFIG